MPRMVLLKSFILTPLIRILVSVLGIQVDRPEALYLLISLVPREALGLLIYEVVWEIDDFASELANDPWLLCHCELRFFYTLLSAPSPTSIPFSQIKFPLHFAHTFLSCLPTVTKERVPQ